jgi:hypothetical protein
MNALLSFFIGIVVQDAFAVTLEARGAGAPGIDGMWARICSVMGCTLGPNAVFFFAQQVVDFIFPLVGVTAVCIVIWAGIKLTTSEGNDEGRSEAKKIIIQACSGIVLALIAGGVVRFFGEEFLLRLLD